MLDYAVQLANELKKRDNKVPMGAMLGKVLSTGANWQVTVKDGKFIIDKSNGYICNQILERKTAYSHSNSGSISVSCTGGSGGGYSASGSGNIHLKEVWKVGDLVLVLPAEGEQFFFIIDIVRK